MKTKFPSIRLLMCILFSTSALLSSASAPMDETYWARQLQEQGKMNLPVDAILQSKWTSCGEAAITMAYNYAYPETQITESDVIEYATSEGYYTERRRPFTSPDDMVSIAEYYADTVSTGAVTSADEGLAFLTEKLTDGHPVIIDIFARLDDPSSGAHFVVVTGLAIDPKNPNATRIYFNDPLMGKNRWGYWTGGEGVWNAWQNNNDSNGSGWWMIVSSL